MTGNKTVSYAPVSKVLTSQSWLTSRQAPMSDLARLGLVLNIVCIVWFLHGSMTKCMLIGTNSYIEPNSTLSRSTHVLRTVNEKQGMTSNCNAVQRSLKFYLDERGCVVLWYDTKPHHTEMANNYVSIYTSIQLTASYTIVLPIWCWLLKHLMCCQTRGLHGHMSNCQPTAPESIQESVYTTLIKETTKYHSLWACCHHRLGGACQIQWLNAVVRSLLPVTVLDYCISLEYGVATQCP